MLVHAVTLPARVVGQLAGFGAGALIGAASFQLMPEALESLDSLEIGIWLLLGGGVFVIADTIIDRLAAGIWAVVGFGITLATS